MVHLQQKSNKRGLLTLIDYRLKAVVLKQHKHLLDVDKEFRASKYRLDNFLYNGVVPYGYEKFNENDLLKSLLRRCNLAIANFDFNTEKYPIEMQEAVRINNATYRRNTRLNNRIKTMLNDDKYQHIFLTLTFYDDVLNSTSPETRRRYVTRFLKQYTNYYVANIDYGKKYEREHYHAVVNCLKNINCQDWPFGAINFKRIHTPNFRALSKYVNKLTNHAIKETTKRSAIIYSKNY